MGAPRPWWAPRPLVGTVPGGAAVTHPAKVMLEDAQRTAEVGAAPQKCRHRRGHPTSGLSGVGGNYFLSSVTGQAEVPGTWREPGELWGWAVLSEEVLTLGHEG